ncbi:MAG: N-acetyltransferase [Rhodospirillales bacterium]|nr:MAG: N-acetyltransferase [Rhodospirillales bacterium]
MSNDVEIRQSLPADIHLIEQLYPDAFPDEDLLPLVRELLREDQHVLSLVANLDRTLAGHIIFTRCGVDGRTDQLALLGPLAVAPNMQRRGIGSALVREGLQQLRAEGILQVCVLGDPAYYGRFRFAPEYGVMPPYPLPEAWRTAWQSICLLDGQPALQGTLSVPPPWRHEALWAP